MAGLSIVKKEMHYVYLDLGDREYCTVAIPSEIDKAKSADISPKPPKSQIKSNGRIKRGGSNSPLRPLFEQQTSVGGPICCI